MSSFLSKFSFQQNKRRYINLKGIISRRYAYKGPDVVQIDLTDKCNSSCLACWIHSPFLNKNKIVKKDELDFSILKSFIEDSAKIGVKEIILSGGGEPFLYPRIWEVLEIIEKTGLSFRLNTNFILLEKPDIKRIVSFKKLASVSVSVWAPQAELYAKIHGRQKDDFYRVKNNLKFLNTCKSNLLTTVLSVIITNLNYRNLKDLFNFAVETRCDSVEFGLADVIPEATDQLLLNQNQLDCLFRYFLDALKYKKKKNIPVKIANKNIFLKRILNQKAFRGEYDSRVAGRPCYAGWFFLRLRANGDFNPCLKAHRAPTGNIYKENIFSLWNNFLQQKFRIKSLNLPKDRKYFNRWGNAFDGDIGCKRACDNILINQSPYRLIRYIQKKQHSF